MSCLPCFSSKVKPEDGRDDSLLQQRLEEATRRISELEAELRKQTVKDAPAPQGGVETIPVKHLQPYDSAVKQDRHQDQSSNQPSHG